MKLNKSLVFGAAAMVAVGAIGTVAYGFTDAANGEVAELDQSAEQGVEQNGVENGNDATDTTNDVGTEQYRGGGHVGGGGHAGGGHFGGGAHAGRGGFGHAGGHFGGGRGWGGRGWGGHGWGGRGWGGRGWGYRGGRWGCWYGYYCY
jgi:hypothetical protein